MTVRELQNRIQTNGVSPQNQPARVEKNRQPGFEQILSEKLAGSAPQVKFSAHALERLASRNIILTENDIHKLNNAVQTMEDKGGKDSLLMMGDLAFVVSVENRTVITVMDKNAGGDERIFTKIDSALIA